MRKILALFSLLALLSCAPVANFAAREINAALSDGVVTLEFTSTGFVFDPVEGVAESVIVDIQGENVDVTSHDCVYEEPSWRCDLGDLEDAEEFVLTGQRVSAMISFRRATITSPFLIVAY